MTDRVFEDMLNEHLGEDLLVEEFIPRVYVWQGMEKDETWLGGDYIVPFRGGHASSLEYGALTASNDVSQSTYVRGKVEDQIELWGTLKFNARDIMEHGKVSERNFLKLLPDEIEDFLDFMKNVVSVNILAGAAFATAVADGDVSGNLTVDRPDRFTIDQKVIIDDSNSSPATGYVKTIDVNSGVINFVTARGGATPVDLSGYTVSQVAKCYYPGAQAGAFSSLRSGLLSAANGGSSALYGQTKTAYPYLQAININGDDITRSNILSKLFTGLTRYRLLSKGNATEIWMSYTIFSACITAVENSKGAFNVVPNTRKTSVYNWQEVMIGSVTQGAMKIVGLQEADDDVIMIIDWRALKFASNGLFKKHKSPDGISYHVERATTGYVYLVDICLFGEFILKRPSYCGIFYGVDIDAA